MVMSAGQIEYAISVNTQALIDARRDIENLNSRIDSGMNQNQNSVNSLSTSFTKLAGAVAGVFAAGQFSAFVQETAAAIDTQKKFADRIQISYEELQKLQYAAGQSGVGAGELNVALQRMSRRLETVAQGAAPAVSKQLELMGLNIQEIKDMSPDQQFLAIADGINTLGSEASKTTAAFAIFDSGAVGLTNTFRMGSKGITDLGNGLEDLGGLVSTEAAANFETFNDQVENVEIAFKSLKVNALAGFSDDMVEITKVMSDFVKDSEKVEMVLNGVGIAAMSLSTVIIARTVASFAALVATQVTAIASTIATSVALSGMTASAYAAATAAKALRGAMALLGGPVGAVIVAGVGFTAFAVKLAEAHVALDELTDATNNASNKFNELSLDDFNDALDENRINIAKTISNIEKAKSVKFSIVDIDAFREAQEEIKNLNKQLVNLQIEQNIIVKTKIKKEDAKKLADKLKKEKDEAERELSRSNLLNIAAELNVDLMTDEEKLREAYKRTVKQIRDYAGAVEGVGDEVRAALDAAKATLDKGLAELGDSGADGLKEARDKLLEASIPTGTDIDSSIARVRATEEKELESLKKVYNNRKELETEYAAAVKNTKLKANQEIEQLLEQDALQQQAYADMLGSIILDSQRTREDGLELINLNEEEALKDLEKTHEGHLENNELYEKARLAIQQKYAFLRQQEQDAQNKKAEEQAKKASDAAKKVQEDAAKEREKQNKANDSFSSFAESFVETTPLEDIANREAEAIEKLKELYGESTADVEEFNKGVNDINAAFAKERQEQMLADQMAFGESVSQLLAASGDGFAALADVISQSGEESSTAYKALFAISKGFAVAQASLNFALSLTNALASGPFPANLAAVAATASSGVALVSAVTSATYTGRQNGGPTSPNSTYKVNENSPEVYSYGNSDYLMTGSSGGSVTPLDQYMNGQGGGVNVIINNNAAGVEVSASQGVSENEVIVLIQETVPAEISNPNSKTSKAIKASTTSRRKLT